jgi:hypothetical protein
MSSFAKWINLGEQLYYLIVRKEIDFKIFVNTLAELKMKKNNGLAWIFVQLIGIFFYIYI